MGNVQNNDSKISFEIHANSITVENSKEFSQNPDEYLTPSDANILLQNPKTESKNDTKVQNDEKSPLKIHEKTISTIEKNSKGFLCDMCDFKFGEVSLLEEHITIAHLNKSDKLLNPKTELILKNENEN